MNLREPDTELSRFPDSPQRGADVPAPGDRSVGRWMVAAYVCTAAAMAFVLGIAGWGAYRDLEEGRITLLQSEINRVRSHNLRTVALIQDQLYREGAHSDLSNLRDAAWLRTHWQRWIPLDKARVYAAVVDAKGRIVMHSEPALEGGLLARDWYARRVPEAGADVFETNDPRLTGGTLVYDIQVPIYRAEPEDKPRLDRDLDAGEEVGAYHCGFNYPWLEERLNELQSRTRWNWAGRMAVIVVVVAVAGLSLMHITRRLTLLQEAVGLARVRRLAELGQLAGSIAHEIRNPLNAIRLNLHAIDRLSASHAAESDGEARHIIRETVGEIERVEGLVRSLLDYARPERPRNERLEVGQEVAAAVQFLRPLLDREQVTLSFTRGDAPAWVLFDRRRLRQVVLNLVTNALEAAGPGGAVGLDVTRTGGMVEVCVSNNGPGIPPADRQRIFEPFFTTKELGTGLGLTLVKRFIEDGGGEIVCQSDGPVGAAFRVRLPPAPADADKAQGLVAANHRPAEALP